MYHKKSNVIDVCLLYYYYFRFITFTFHQHLSIAGITIHPYIILKNKLLIVVLVQ